MTDLFDDGHLTHITGRATFDEGHISGKTHAVHVVPGR